LRALQAVWPDTRYTWIIGRAEHKLMSLVPDVEFISYDKRGGLGALRDVQRALRGRRFDVLLHLQLALRASLIASLVRARRRIGFDRARARELQWVFTNERIAARSREHVLDAFWGFTDALGIPRRPPHWDVPLPPAATEYAATLAPTGCRTLLISPCSSHTARNWRPERYAAVAEHAHTVHGLDVILCGGPSAVERTMADAIVAACRVPVRDQVGRDTLPQLLALMARARALITPDSGPAHMATMVGLPVVGLYAATNPARSGPYFSLRYCVDRYALAAERILGASVDTVPWTTKIERPGVMDLIEVSDVTARLDQLMAESSATP